MPFFFFFTERIFHVFWIESEGFYWLDWLNKQPAHMTCTANLRAEKGFHNKKNQYLERTGSCYQGNWARHSLESR